MVTPPVDTSPPVDTDPPVLDPRDDCLKDGYKDFGFKNQGQCVRSVVGKGESGST
jgi:hypothetical protein